MPVTTAPITTSGNASSQVTISNVSAVVSPARLGRRGVLILNLQSVAVYLNAAGGIALTTHFRLDPGASIYLPVTNTITGITSAAYTASPTDAQLHVLEYF